MPDQAILLLIALAIIANLIVLIALVVPAITRPSGRSGLRALDPSGGRSLEAAVVGGTPAADRPEPAAFRPSPEKLSKMILASLLKLLMRKAKKPI